MVASPVGQGLVPRTCELFHRCPSEGRESGGPDDEVVDANLVDQGDNCSVVLASELTTRRQGAPSPEVQRGIGESTDRRADHPRESVVSVDPTLDQGCSTALDAWGREGPCSPGCSPAIVINKVCIQAVTVRVPMTVCGISTMAVVDSGAEVTVMSDGFFSSIPEANRPPLQKASLKLVVADQKSVIRGQGIAQVLVRISRLEFSWPVYVAPIADHLLLGCDVMDAMDLQVSPRRGLWVEDHWLPCQVSRTPYGPKPVPVTLQEATLLPANHEVVTLGKTPQNSVTPGLEAIFEPVPHGLDGLLAARALVTASDALPLRLINVSSQPLELPAGFRIRELQSVASEETPTEGKGPLIRVASLKAQGPQHLKEGGSSVLTRDSDPVIPVEDSLEDLPEHLQDLYHQTAENIDSPAVRMQLAGVLLRRQASFARNRLDLGTFSAIKHTIDTGCGAAVRERVRRTPRGFEEEEEKCLREQLESGVIRPSSSAWAAPTVLVRKADGSVRFCIDYRGLNSRTIKDAYPLPRIDMCFDCLGDMSYFSTLDLQSGYWQVQVEESDIHKTAFITKYGLFECIKMPFGLCSAPSTFQRCMELVFRGLQWRTLLIYLDDIIILGRTMEENLERLDEALGRLQAANLKLKPSKCKLLQREVLFLGHIVSSEGARPNPKLVETVCQWNPPQDRRGVQQFLGLCNYYRRFVPNFSAIASPLTELTSKTVAFQWTEAANLAFLALKTALTTAPVLSFPLPSGEYLLDTDASDLAVGGVLAQIQDGEEKVIAYSSKKLNKQQRRYCVTRRELLAVVTFLREFRNYLLAQEFVIRTDHNSLTWLLRFKEPQGQLARWLEYAFQFRFRIVHRPGKKHGNADALSRLPSAAEEGSCDEYQPGFQVESLPCGGCKYCAKRHEEWADFQENVDDVVPLVTGGEACRKVTTRSQAHEASTAGDQPSPISRDSDVRTSWVPGYTKAELAEAQKCDPVLRLVHLWVSAKERPGRDGAASLSPAARTYWLNFDNLLLEDGVLYLQWLGNDARPSTLRLLVPRSLQPKVLKTCHDTLFAAHMGVRRTVDQVKRRFHWPGLRKDVKLHIRCCKVCNANKMPYQRFRAALANFRVGAPLDRIGVDLMGPLPVTDQGNRYLLVIVDYFTRWAEAFSLPDQQAETVARTLVLEFVCRYGAPLELHSDQGRNFESALFQEVCRLFEIVKTRTSPYHPSGNGLVERFNRTLGSLIRSYLEGRPSDWDKFIPLLTSAYRSTPHPSTGFSPNFLMFGREVTTPVDLLFPRPPRTSSPDVPEYVADLTERLHECYELARNTLRSAAERQKRDHDTRVVQNLYEPGALVMKRFHRHKKFETPWVGPLVVRKRISDCLYLVASKQKTFVLHHDLLKPYEGSDVPRWVAARPATHWWARCNQKWCMLFGFVRRAWTMALTTKKSHRGPVFRCQACPWEGDKKGTIGHVVAAHRTVEEAPFYCTLCPARFLTARAWRRHPGQPSHRAKATMRPEQAGSALGRGGPSVKFDGEGAEALQMDREYSERYWMLVSQAAAAPRLADSDTDDEDPPSPSSGGETPSVSPDMRVVKLFPIKSVRKESGRVEPASVEKTKKSLAKESGRVEPASVEKTVSVEKTKKSLAKESGRVEPASVEKTATVEKTKKSLAKESGRVEPASVEKTVSVEKTKKSLAKESGRVEPASVEKNATVEKTKKSLAKESGRVEPASVEKTATVEKTKKSLAKESGRDEPASVEKTKKSLAKESGLGRSGQREPDSRAEDKAKKPAAKETGRDWSGSGLSDVINLDPSDEETNTLDWRDELDYGEEGDWEPGRCPQEPVEMRDGLQAPDLVVPTSQVGSPTPTHPMELVTPTVRSEPSLLPAPSAPSQPSDQAVPSPPLDHAGPSLPPGNMELVPPTSRETTHPVISKPGSSTGAVPPPPPLSPLGADWPERLGKAAGEAFSEGLRVALKPLEKEAQRQTKALESLAEEEKKTAGVLQKILKALSGEENRREETKGGSSGKRSRSPSHNRREETKGESSRKLSHSPSHNRREKTKGESSRKRGRSPSHNRREETRGESSRKRSRSPSHSRGREGKRSRQHWPPGYLTWNFEGDSLVFPL